MSGLPEEAEVLYRLAKQDRLAFQTLWANQAIELRIVGFHAQQAVEKLLKAVLVASGAIFPPTHNLLKLADLLEEQKISFPMSLITLANLNPYAVVFRYDDREIHTLDRRGVAEIVDVVFAWADSLLSQSE